MTRKGLDTSKEIRLWIGQIIVPAVLVGSMIIGNNQEAKEAIKMKVNNLRLKLSDIVRPK